MVAVDWDRVLSLNPLSLKDDEIEDLYPMVVECDAEEINNIHNLQALFKISQEILQIKDSQVNLCINIHIFKNYFEIFHVVH